MSRKVSNFIARFNLNSLIINGKLSNKMEQRSE